jgi:hypothetical protein
VTDEPKRTFLPQGMVEQWKEELDELKKQSEHIQRGIKHLEWKIRLGGMIEDAYGDLLKAMQAKPTEPEYCPNSYDF